LRNWFMGLVVIVGRSSPKTLAVSSAIYVSGGCRHQVSDAARSGFGASLCQADGLDNGSSRNKALRWAIESRPSITHRDDYPHVTLRVSEETEGHGGPLFSRTMMAKWQAELSSPSTRPCRFAAATKFDSRMTIGRRGTSISRTFPAGACAPSRHSPAKRRWSKPERLRGRSGTRPDAGNN
jgi:hypothetical protein